MLVSDAVRRGSSPLMRGKHVRSDVDVVAAGLIPAHAGKTEQAVPASRGRLIPAHAGKTCPSRRPRVGSTAHPRSRGENASSKIGPASSGGSSPLTRGKLKLTAYLAPSNRLIPAHAGKTMTLRKRGCARTAHPRSRGENALVQSPAKPTVGSSPLTRGKRPPEMRRRLPSRLIPAHAGKTVPRA